MNLGQWGALLMASGLVGIVAVLAFGWLRDR